MLTRRTRLMYDALYQMLLYMGDDPRVFSLYFTCKVFYGLLFRTVNPVYGGFDKFRNYGPNWIIPLENVIYKKKLQLFYREQFKGYLVCDFEPLYAYFFVYDIGYCRIPVNIVKAFYIVKYGGLKNVNDTSLYVLRKNHLLIGKSNIISLNEANVLTTSDSFETKMNVVVDENYVVHDDSFIVGIKISTFGVVLTSQFFIGNVNFFGISCYASFKMWLKNMRLANIRFLKCCFSYYPFMKKIMAMYQCKRCIKILKRFFEYFFKRVKIDSSVNNFQCFAHRMFYNMKRRPKIINMNNSFTMKYGYSDASVLPKAFDHLRNGELVHDCYYDLIDSEKKILFIEDLHFIKQNEYGCMKLASPFSLIDDVDLNIDTRLDNIRPNLEGRSKLYFRSLKRTFAFFAIF